MSAIEVPWHAADKAYQAHHAACPQCCASGLNPGGPDRCAVGADLWAAYQGAGAPPHFVWLHRTLSRAAA